MDQLFLTLWRFMRATTAGIEQSCPGIPKSLAAYPGDSGCVFCNLIAAVDHAIANGMPVDQAEAAGGLVLRGKHCYICLNAYPYTSGHIMVVPYAHLDRLSILPTDGAHEMMDLAQRSEVALRQLLSAAWAEFRDESLVKVGAWRCGAPASACASAMGGRYELPYDDGSRDAGAA